MACVFSIRGRVKEINGGGGGRAEGGVERRVEERKCVGVCYYFIEADVFIH
jgi:hypothetical protein